MSDLVCGGCTACCRWGTTAGDIEIRPRLTDEEAKKWGHEKTPSGEKVMRADEQGNCVHLGDEGCGIHGQSPAFCRAFDCRDLYSKVINLGGATMIRVLIQGGLRSKSRTVGNCDYIQRHD